MQPLAMHDENGIKIPTPTVINFQKLSAISSTNLSRLNDSAVIVPS